MGNTDNYFFIDMLNQNEIFNGLLITYLNTKEYLTYFQHNTEVTNVNIEEIYNDMLAYYENTTQIINAELLFKIVKNCSYLLSTDIFNENQYNELSRRDILETEDTPFKEKLIPEERFALRMWEKKENERLNAGMTNENTKRLGVKATEAGKALAHHDDDNNSKGYVSAGIILIAVLNFGIGIALYLIKILG